VLLSFPGLSVLLKHMRVNLIFYIICAALPLNVRLSVLAKRKTLRTHLPNVRSDAARDGAVG
jgi:hypothetical protein